jgi:hypothetical protein
MVSMMWDEKCGGKIERERGENECDIEAGVGEKGMPVFMVVCVRAFEM